MRGQYRPFADHRATHFDWACADGVATVILNLNPAVDRFSRKARC
jgi:hypothetical protein